MLNTVYFFLLEAPTVTEQQFPNRLKCIITINDQFQNIKKQNKTWKFYII